MRRAATRDPTVSTADSALAPGPHMSGWFDRPGDPSVNPRTNARVKTNNWGGSGIWIGRLGLLQDSTLVRKRRSICHVPAPDPGDRLPLDYSPPDFYPRSRAGSCFFLLQVKQAAVGSHSCSAASYCFFLLLHTIPTFDPIANTAAMVPFPYFFFLKKTK